MQLVSLSVFIKKIILNFKNQLQAYFVQKGDFPFLNRNPSKHISIACLVNFVSNKAKMLLQTTM